MVQRLCRCWWISTSNFTIANSAGFGFLWFVGLCSSLLGLPFEVYDTFWIEEKFGFNKTTPAVFVMDKLKGLLLGIVVGGGIIALLTFLYGLLGDKFWLAAWAVVALFSIFFAMFYTNLLLPIFNKLTPLEKAENCAQALKNTQLPFSFR